MLGRSYENEYCSSARALEIVGERWSLLILRNAMFANMTRFSDFQRSLQVAPNILTKRLQFFVEEGLMETSQSPEGGEYLEYFLTKKGLDFKAVIIALTEWGDRWAAPNGPPKLYIHDECGGRVETHLHCKSCKTAPKLESISAQTNKAWLKKDNKG